MKGISEFLAKFKVIPNPKDEKRIIAEIIMNVLVGADEEGVGLVIDENNLEIKGYSVFLNIHPALKGLVFQKKMQILEKINERFKEKNFKNIL